MVTPGMSGGIIEELKSPLAPHEAVAEAARCLYCYDAPCARGCPTQIDVASFIRKIVTGNLRGAARTLLSANVLAASCARVCPTEELCKGRCVLPDKGDPPIDIGGLQRYVMDWAMAQEGPPVAHGEPTRKRVSVVGAGPAGLACAVQLRRYGHTVIIYDAAKKPGGLGTYGIASYKMKPEFAEKEVQWLARTGFEIRLGFRIGEHLTLRELEDTSDAVFIGVGLSEPYRLGIEGEDMPGVVDALPLIKANKNDETLPIVLEGKQVLVIGGGNTAMDSAILAHTLGAGRTTIVYRRSEAEMPAYSAELDMARRLGVELLFLHAPVDVIGEDRITGLQCQPTRLGEPDASGRRRPVPTDDPPVTLPADVVIRALGQHVDERLVAGVPGIRVKQGRIKVIPESGQTGNPRYFAGGDCVNGGREVVMAVADGMRAARSIHRLITAGKED